MATAASVLAPPSRPARPALASAHRAMLGVVTIALAGRIVAGLGAPLWFDETFSAVIASQPDPAALVDWCRAEIGGPAYYLLLWLWAQAFGTSATALRALSFAASLAAPALIAWRGHPDRATRLTWAALVALWLPAFVPASDARPYALAMLATTAQAIAFRALIDAPTRGRAFAWVSASVIALLCHLHAGALALVGGLLFLGIHRRRALACWPALAPLIPAAGWFVLQYPVLARFGGAGAWYPKFGVVDLLLAPVDLFDSVALGAVLTIAPLIARAKGGRGGHARADRALAASGLLALTLVLAVAVLRPSFTWRYAIPFGPAILFAVAIWAQGLRARLAIAPMAVVAMFAASALGRVVELATHRGEDLRSGFNLVLPSEWLAQHGARRLLFLWDGPTGAMSDPRRIDEVAGYFLRRHAPATVRVLRAPGAVQPAPLVAATIREGTSDALIWIADSRVPGTHGAPDRRMMARLGWTCRDYGRDTIRVLTCRAPGP